MSATAPRRYRLALVGCGDIAEQGHLPALLRHPRFQVAAVCDIRPDRAALLAGQAGVTPCHDYRALLDRRDLDAVLLALHPEISVPVALAFLERGLPVLDEKPFAAGLDDGRHLLAAADRPGAVYQIGFVFGYCDMVRDLARYAQRAGTPAVYRVAVYDERLDRGNVAHFQRIGQALGNSSAVTHEGSHVVDYVRLWNPASYVAAKATAVRTAADLPGPNLWSVQLPMADGSLLLLDIGWMLPDLPTSEISIQGPQGVLRMEMVSGRGEFRGGGRAEAVATPGLRQPWDRQLDAFADAIDRGRSTVAPAQRGWNALAVTKACERAAATGQTVPLEPALPLPE